MNICITKYKVKYLSYLEVGKLRFNEGKRFACGSVSGRD